MVVKETPAMHCLSVCPGGLGKQLVLFWGNLCVSIYQSWASITNSNFRHYKSANFITSATAIPQVSKFISNRIRKPAMTRATMPAVLRHKIWHKRSPLIKILLSTILKSHFTICDGILWQALKVSIFFFWDKPRVKTKLFFYLTGIKHTWRICNPKN